MTAIAGPRRCRRRSSAPLAVAALVALAALAACGSDDDDSSDTQPTLATVAPTTDAGTDSIATDSTPRDSADTPDATDDASDTTVGDTTVGSGPDIEPSSVGTVDLVEPGAEPREPLRLQLEAGTTSTFVMTVGLNFSMTFEGDPLPETEIPTMAITTEMVIDEIDAEGRASYSFTFTSIDAVEGTADDETVEAMQPVLDQMEGVAGHATVDDRGKTLDATIDTSSVDDPAVRAQLDQFVNQVESLGVPFPEEAVGVGARWIGTTRSTLNGITTNVETEYHLTARTGDAYELDITQHQTAEPGPIELPNLPAGSQAEMRSTDVRGSGTMSGRVVTLIPVSELRSSGTIRMFLDIGPQTGEVVQDLEVELTVDAG